MLNTSNHKEIYEANIQYQNKPILERLLIKTCIYLLVWGSIFLKAYGDTVIQNGGEGNIFEVKHALLVLASILSLVFSSKKLRKLHLSQLKVFLKVALVLIVISMVKIFINGHPSFLTIKELTIFLYPMLFAVGILSFLNAKEVQFMMKIGFFIYIAIYMLTYSELIFNPSTYASINFLESYSPLEDSFFSSGMDGFFIFFVMTSSSKFMIIISAIFNFMVFKRISVIFIPIFIISRVFFIDSDFYKRKAWILGAILTFLASTGMFIFMNPEFLAQLSSEFPELNLQNIFMGRNRMFEFLLNSNFQSSGLGTTQITLGKIFENEGLKLMLEVGLLGLIAVIWGLWKITANNKLAIVIVTYISLTFINATVLFGSASPSLMFPVYMAINIILQRGRKENYELSN